MLVQQVENKDPQYERVDRGNQQGVEVVGIDPDTGEVVWEVGNVATYATARCQPAVDSDGRVWVVRQPAEDGNYMLQAADSDTGELLDGVSVDLGGEHPCGREAPLMVTGGGDDERVVVPGTGDAGALTVVDVGGDDPAVAWQLGEHNPDYDVLVNVPRAGTGPGAIQQYHSTPAVASNDALILPVRTGADPDADPQADPDTDELGEIELVELSLADGSERSRVEVPAPDPQSGEDWEVSHYLRIHVALTDDDVLVVHPMQDGGWVADTDAPSYLAALDASDGLSSEPEWIRRLPREDESANRLSLGEGVVLTHNAGDPRAFSLADGGEQWHAEVSGSLDRDILPVDARGHTYTRADGHDGVLENHLLAFDHRGALQWTVSEPALAEELGVDDIGDVDVSLGANLMLGPLGPDGTLYATTRPGNEVLAIDDSGGLGEVVDPPDDPDEDRVAGATRYETAVELSREFAQVDTVLIARGDDYADALAGAPLATSMEAPILLTPPASLDEGAAAEIERLGASEAVLLGGKAALSPQVEDDLDALGLDTQRFAGDSRFETAALIAAELPDPDTAYVVRGLGDDPETGWEDAVAVSALAAFEGNPILLTTETVQPGDTRDALEGFDRAVIVGGTAVVDESVEADIDEVVDEVSRLAGANRYETSIEVVDAAAAAAPEHFPGDNWFPGDTWMATGLDFADAIAAAPVVGNTTEHAEPDPGLLVLVDGEDLDRSQASIDFLQANAEEIDRVRAVGGTAVITDDSLDRARTYIEKDQR